ncbi:HNH endonuclease [Acinetobacter sp. ANC 4636]
MASLYLNRLKANEREQLINVLHEAQKGMCFICEKPIDLVIHSDSIDIDHVIPSAHNGKDDPSNFALTHASCNRSKQASNLEVARILQRFKQLKEDLQHGNKVPNLAHILENAKGGQHELNFKIEDDVIHFSFSSIGDEKIYQLPLYQDDLSGFKYFFAKMPIEYLHHDQRINPRSIGPNISKLVEEFYQKRPQLHIPLAWMQSQNNKSGIFIFDGQHKAAAQIMLGVRSLPVRVFVDVDADVLITTNFNAGTTLKQVAFDKSVQRHLGSTLYQDKLQRYRMDTTRAEDDFSFSEKDLASHFKGQSREIKRYVLDSVRNAVITSPENKLRDYIDMAGKATEKPISYISVERTFYSFFIHSELLETRLDYKSDVGENPRELEVSQLVQLMNIIAEEFYIEKYDFEIGTGQIESKIQKGQTIPLEHLKAFRLSKEEIVYNWLSLIRELITNYYSTVGGAYYPNKPFQIKFPDQLWTNIRNFLRNFAALPFLVNTQLSSTIFSGKRSTDYWQTILKTGESNDGIQVMPEGLILVQMQKPL